METASGSSHSSSKDYARFIQENLGKNKDFKMLCDEFKSIDFSNSIKTDKEVETRLNHFDAVDFLSNVAVKSNDINDFSERSIGFLPISEHQKLFKILKLSEKYYDDLVWENYKAKNETQIRNLEKFQEDAQNLFLKFNHFYQSSWTKEIPFYVTLYPIPLKNGTSTATPHSNVLTIGSMTEVDDTNGNLGIIMHEMCHVLYDEQTIELKQNIENNFKENKSPYSKLAYSYLDEALATALGNGFAYKYLNNNVLDSHDWYNNTTINRFAKGIYPIVENYLNSKKTIDKEFINQVILKFGEIFPDSIYEYDINLNNLGIAANEGENYIFDYFFKYFEGNSINLSTPINETQTLDYIKNADKTQLIIVNNKQKETYLLLKKIFPEISNIKYKNKFKNLSFLDTKNRLIIIIFPENKDDLDFILKTMSETKTINKNIIQF